GVGLVFLLFPAAEVLRLRTVSGNALLCTVLLLATELLLGVPMGVIAGIYRATGHLPRAAVLGGIRQGSMFAVTLLLILVYPSFVAVAAGRVLVALAITGAILVDLRRLHPWLRLFPDSGSWG